jgi:uncharacterized protein YbaA (DUF1428 family)
MEKYIDGFVFPIPEEHLNKYKDIAKEVAIDPRIEKLVAPLNTPSRVIFDPKRMAYGGFKPLF